MLLSQDNDLSLTPCVSVCACVCLCTHTHIFDIRIRRSCACDGAYVRMGRKGRSRKCAVKDRLGGNPGPSREDPQEGLANSSLSVSTVKVCDHDTGGS